MCTTPLGVRNKFTMEIRNAPCGKCPQCLARRVSSWSFRLMEEYRVSISAYFITLTYDTAHIPISKNGFRTLRKSDVQKFFKRLRKAHESLDGDRPPIRYYAVGEYGTRTYRPHYHIILFNANVELIQNAWGLGQVNYGNEEGVSMASCGYTLKYINKKSKIPLHRNDDREKEFPLMSKHLGENYLTPQMIRWHKKQLENGMYCTLKDGSGKKIAMPRYYKDKIYNEHEKKAIASHFKRKHQMQEDIDIVYGTGESSQQMAERHLAEFRRMRQQELRRNKL